MRIFNDNPQQHKNATDTNMVNHSTDLSWLGAPAFLLILCILFIHAKKQGFIEKHRKIPTREISISMMGRS
jgi:hypothetical protein